MVPTLFIIGLFGGRPGSLRGEGKELGGRMRNGFPEWLDLSSEWTGLSSEGEWDWEEKGGWKKGWMEKRKDGEVI